MHPIPRSVLAMTSMALGAVLLSLQVTAHEPGAAHYVGNEGVLVTHGAQGVLFDAFFDQSYGTYVVPSPESYAAIMAGEGPYDGVRAVFVSHIHGDHFSADKVLAYLRAHPQVRVIGPQAVATALADAGAEDEVAGRVVSISSRPGDDLKSERLGDLAFTVVAVPHANPQRFRDVQNLVFRVTLGDALTVMHFGDADPVLENFEPHLAAWRKAGSAAALFPPSWFLRSLGGRAILAGIDADRVVGIHVPAAAQEDPEGFRRALRGDAFVTPGERRQLAHGDER